MSSDVWRWLLLIFWTMGIAIAATQLRKLWMHSERAPIWESVPGWWLWGDSLWRGMVRVIPLSILLGVLSAVAYLFILVTNASDSGVTLSDEHTLAIGVIGVILFLLFALMGSIMLVNRPRLLVPPHLRSQPGAITEWRVAVRRWAARMEGRPTVLKPLLFMLFMLTGQTVGAPRARGRASDDRPGG